MINFIIYIEFRLEEKKCNLNKRNHAFIKAKVMFFLMNEK
jgi:hypothetical protein